MPFPGSSPSSQTITDIEILGMGVDFTKDTPNPTVLLTTSIAAKISLPWPKVVVRNISSVSMDLTIRWHESTVASFSLVSLHPRSFDFATQRIVLDTPKLELTIIDKTGFNGFLNATLMAETVPIEIEGTVSTLVATAMGDLSLTQIPITASASIDG